MSKLFTTVKNKTVKKNIFDLSHEVKFSYNMGDLIPILVQEILPNSKWRVNTETLIRFHPMTAPIFARIDCYIHYFFVPNRIIFKNWGKFITGGEDGNDVTPMPELSILDAYKGNFVKGMLPDYMGIPPIDPSLTVVGSHPINALPFRAYHKIYNEYYRDQNLTTPVPITDDDYVTTAELAELCKVRKRMWSKDYFSSALPFAQKGGDVVLPNDPVYTDTSQVLYANGTNADGALSASGGELNATATASRIENIEGLDISVNDLRKAVRLQQWLEKNARSGSRYVEQLLAHFGVLSDDARQMRPVYLGGGKSNIVVSEVLANFHSAETPLGTMGGHGLGVGNTNNFKHFFNEHGWLIGILSTIPKATYQDGINKQFLKFDKFDYAFPVFANLGEQPVLNKEIFWDVLQDNATNNATWGYQSRYCEYKFNHGRVAGDFRDTLAFWHAGRIFDNRPNLSHEFIECDTASISDRIFPVADAEASHKLYCNLYHNIKALLPLPVYGTPTL